MNNPGARDTSVPLDLVSSPCVLVLASGRGERFKTSGGEGSKLRAMLAGKTVLAHTLDAVRASGLPFHVEDRGHPGMGDSIAAAVRATRHAAGWLILPGDLPLVQPGTLCAIADALSNHTVVIPYYQRQRGHPVAFGPSCLDDLLMLRGPRGADSVLRAQAAIHPAAELHLDDAGIVTDIDTVTDLARAECLISQEPGPAAG
jgi:molybdenum cofactor cytidylyltransferase